jgi:peptide chain release factor 1
MEGRATGGYNIICLTVSGKNVERLRNEVGGHRIQRIPPNERRGRVHTSTVTVAVTDHSVSDVDSPYTCRSERDFRIEWFSGSGAGGQHRNRHFCCARLVHLPTGLKQERQGRSREANYRDAMAALIAMLDDRLRSGSKAVEDDVRRQQIGSGMRGDQRGTYRFQDDVVTGHVTGKSMQASKVMKGGISSLWS